MGSAAIAMAALIEIPASAIAATRIPILVIGGSPSLLNPSIPIGARRLPPDPHYPRADRENNRVPSGNFDSFPEFPETPCVFRRSCRLLLIG